MGVSVVHSIWRDGNRKPGKRAYDTTLGKAIYEHYHGTIQTCVDENIKLGRVPLVIDFHGNRLSYLKGTIARGTGSGAMIKPMLDKFGLDCMTDERSFLGYLKKNGFG